MLSELPVEDALEFNVLSRSWTNCSDWVAALLSTIRDGDAELAKSLLTVAKADCAVERSPEVSALPSAVISVESCELLDELLPLAVTRL